jgi:hypothetical protein
MAEKIERSSRYLPIELFNKVLDALWIAEGALVEHRDETTLPYVLQVLEQTDRELKGETG